MRKGGGKSKGAAYERWVCEQLSLWITNGKRRDCLWRSAMSGGRATIQNRKGKKINVRQAGDITSVSPEGHALTDNFYIECKHVKKLALDQFIVKNTGALAKFWKTAQHAARKYSRNPIIIARQNGWPDLVIFRPAPLMGRTDWLQVYLASGPGWGIARLDAVLKLPLAFKATK